MQLSQNDQQNFKFESSDSWTETYIVSRAQAFMQIRAAVLFSTLVLKVKPIMEKNSHEMWNLINIKYLFK